MAQTTEQNNQISQKPGNSIEFKKVEARLLGPININIESKDDSNEPPKGIDLVLPPVSFAVETKLFLKIPNEEALKQNMDPRFAFSFRSVEQDLEYYLIPTQQGLRLSIRFCENFYSKYADLIPNQRNFSLMAYVIGYVDPQIFNRMQAANNPAQA